MTVNDLLDNFEIQGALRVQRWNEETEDEEYYEENEDEEY